MSSNIKYIGLDVHRSSASNAPISSAVSTAGTRFRFALCRTRLIGFLSAHSYRTACVNTALMMFLIFALLAFARGRPRSQASTSTVRTSESEWVPHSGRIHVLMYEPYTSRVECALLLFSDNSFPCNGISSPPQCAA
jgi:hypothetical protein